VVIHQPYHFQFSDDVLPLPLLVEEHQKASADSDERVVYYCDPQTSGVMPQPDIRQTPENEDDKANQDASQRSNPT
jgi:hypothetical protein